MNPNDKQASPLKELSEQRGCAGLRPMTRMNISDLVFEGASR